MSESTLTGSQNLLGGLALALGLLGVGAALVCGWVRLVSFTCPPPPTSCLYLPLQASCLGCNRYTFYNFVAFSLVLSVPPLLVGLLGYLVFWAGRGLGKLSNRP
jgi:hypothetical protein